MTVEDKFLSKVIPEPNTGCWLWLGYQERGYGYFYYKGRSTRAHRVSYDLFVGPIPEGLHILHKCDIRGCVNPRHLYTGTHIQNMSDMVERNRVHRPYGNLNAVGRTR